MLLSTDTKFLHLNDDELAVSTENLSNVNVGEDTSVDVVLEAITTTPVEERVDDTYIVKEYTKDNHMYAHVYLLGYCEESTTALLVELMESSKEQDIISFHLSNCYICQAVALLSSMVECNAHIVTYGHTLESLESILIWAHGRERNIGNYSRFIVSSYRGYGYGPVGKLEDSVEEVKRMNDLFFTKLINIGIVTGDEKKHIVTTKSDLALFGENLAKRVK